MTRTLLYLLGSSAHSPNVSPFFHQGQDTKPVINAAIAASFANKKSVKEGRRRMKRRVLTGKSAFMQQVKMARQETKISHTLSLMRMMRSHLMRTR